MNLRRVAATTAITMLAVTAASIGIASAGSTEDLGEFTVGETIFFEFDCPTGSNEFILFDATDSEIYNDTSVDVDEDYLFGYPFETGALDPGNYSAVINCDETSSFYDFEFTVVAADPCAPPDSIVTPKGPGRAPHGAPIDCSDSGLPDAGSNTSTVLLFGSLAIVGGAGMLIARRRTLA